MPCENYKNALIEAAASGAEPQSELRAHLAACDACRTVFAEEQSLFASIDVGLRITANAEVSASLLPRVHARFAEETALTRSWAINWFVLASAAAIIAGFFVARGVWRPSVKQNPPSSSAQTNPSAHVFPPRQELTQTPGPTAKSNPLRHLQILQARNSQSLGLQVAHNSIAEVLVPRDQELLLARYAEQWRARKRAPLVAEYSDGTTLALLQIAPIQIAQLDVKLLAEVMPQ
jgi:hypothetical protein